MPPARPTKLELSVLDGTLQELDKMVLTRKGMECTHVKGNQFIPQGNYFQGWEDTAKMILKAATKESFGVQVAVYDESAPRRQRWVYFDAQGNVRYGSRGPEKDLKVQAEPKPYSLLDQIEQNRARRQQIENANGYSNLAIKAKKVRRAGFYGS